MVWPTLGSRTAKEQEQEQLSECRPVKNVKEFAVKYMCSKVKTPCLSQKTLISLKTGFLAMCLDFGQTTPTSPRADGLDS